MAHETEIAALEQAYASGVLTVEYDGKRATYRSQAELLSAISRLKALQSGTPRPRAGFVSWSRGDR
ncbi:phage head-tail joining protein [Rhodoplanes roseus]|uniref:Uncharacterized protein n=1 Tax=Rhodoplanes roseus TaxID=29409 RepID=A0A327KET3_9BRAD|nr:hypothetical protein [Rhodoplanes roseus]RAI36618.1 hypothetical protein CH341_30215 [Rhodoplanes roseus]RAI36674.1 hypothetical protein CH341_30200 [Rhodoplanes roseus]